MALNSATNPKPANVQTTKIPTATQPINLSAAGTASMFNNAQNFITGGSFNNTNNIDTTNGLNVLHKRVAPNAILNAGGRADEVRCHPGTRKEVIGRIEKWRDAECDQAAPIFWLSGPAGAGKSAIVQTIAERCKAQGVPQANFFFFRADGSRSNALPLVSTLLHQIILLYPSLRDHAAHVLSANPLIFDSILEEQLALLISEPLCAAQQLSPFYRPLIILIDGLDECDSESKRIQSQILQAFDKILAKYPFPVRFLLASRDESQIRMAFNDISSSLISLYLDDQYHPERDIRVFVNDQFKRVRRTHALAHTLNTTWPTVNDIDDIVTKSSGQFIYAATVMRLISDSSASPMLSLEKVRGAVKIANKSPFSHLDAIYTYVLSQADDQGTLKAILHAQLLLNDLNDLFGDVKLAELLQMYDTKYDEALVCSCLADLTSIARYTDDHKLLFYHASFSDHLLDRSRSKDYYVDFDSFNFIMQPVVWKYVGVVPGVDWIAYQGLRALKKLPPDFLNILLTLDPSKFRKYLSASKTATMFKSIYNLCTRDDDFTSYKQILRRWTNILTIEDIYMIECKGGLPCSLWYFMMYQIERNLSIEPDDETAIALCPETDFDTRETALWLNNILHCIYRKYYPDRRLLNQWISWAVQNGIPLDDLGDIPGAQWYLRKIKLEKWAARYFKISSGKK